MIAIIRYDLTINHRSLC